MELNESLQHVNKYFNECDWSNRSFSWKKSYICAVFSNVAYHHISDFELENTNNVNLIPSSEYEKSIKAHLVRNGVSTDTLFQEYNLEAKSFTLETPFVIASVSKINDVVFVSLRGTELSNMHDWRTNLNARKISPIFYRNAKEKFHLGFYKEVLSFKELLEISIMEKFPGELKIYVTGHSLGGALGAILYGLWAKYQHYSYSGFFGAVNSNHSRKYGIISSYTFGMPRYGNIAATAFFPNPYHVFNSRDIIPNFPPKVLGYANCNNNFPLDKSLSIDAKYTGYFRYLKKTGSILIFKKIEHHSIENYVERIFHECKK